MLRFVTLLLCLTAALAAGPQHKLPLTAHRDLMNFMVKSSAASQENPARSMDCFSYYVPVLNNITDEYESNYHACLLTASGATDRIDAETKPQRDGIETDAQDACSALKECVAYENSIDYFSCFNVAGSNNSKVMYNISANSADILLNVREQYRLVETEENRCTNASERVYVEKTTATYEELQGCLQGKAPVPQPTTAPPATAPTTQPPATEPTTEPATEQQTTTESHESEVENELVDNSRSRMLQDSKWRHILGKLGSHLH